MRTIPTATYRLQLHDGFTFGDAAEVVSYLAALGVSHVYLSPIFAAVPGSTHGYDVLDPREVNPVLGGEAGFQHLLQSLEAHGMQALLDIVPNHVGIAGAYQPWWRDVLRWGKASRFAPFFDIDWEAGRERPAGKVSVPILDGDLDDLIASGDVRFGLHEGESGLQYGTTWLPLAPETYGEALGNSALLAEASGSAGVQLPVAPERLLAGPLDTRRAALDALTAAVRGDPQTRDAVAELLDQANAERDRARIRSVARQQHYWLTNWRTVGEDFNYRRFFAIDDLAAVRVEDAEVFEYTHRLILQLNQQDTVAGVRVDHVDGLYDPPGYLYRLRGALERSSHARKTILVEKVLALDERLPPDWPVDGATGYEFLARVDGLFVDGAAEAAMTETYAAFADQHLPFEEVEEAAREEFAETEFIAERERLVRLARAALADDPLTPAPDDVGLREAMTAVLAAMQRYRTYLRNAGTNTGDADVLTGAIVRAGKRRPELTPALKAISMALRPDQPAGSTSITALRVRFRRAFDQIASAVAAKGGEDTAFYRYSRLLCLNEVGATPAQFGTAPDDLHAWFEHRATVWPAAMSASSTHDTKRDEDVRARIAVLSEMPDAWATEVKAWRGMNEGYRRTLDGQGSPTREREYYVYQTLVGTWEGRADQAYRERIIEHLVKAMREAKQRTTWIDPDNAYERAAREFVELILADTDFTRRLDGFTGRIRVAGRINAFAALVLKAIAPGVPDFYQGTESPAYSLTDPDNRRPVDFPHLASTLESNRGDPPPLMDDGFKQWLTRRLLQVRRDLGPIMTSPEYTPVRVSGPRASNLFAFQRGGPGARVVAVVPRLMLPLLSPDDTLPANAWDETVLHLNDPATTWREALSGTTVEGGDVDCGTLLRGLPFAVLADTGGTSE